MAAAMGFFEKLPIIAERIPPSFLTASGQKIHLPLTREA